MSNSVDVTVTSAGVAVTAPQDCAALIAQQAQGTDPPSVAYSVYSDAALTNKIADVPAGQGYTFVPTGKPGAQIFPSGAVVGYLKVASGSYTFTIGVVPAYMNTGGNVNSLDFQGPSQDAIAQTITGDGAITAKQGTVLLSKGTAGAITIADPIAGVDDGKLLRVVTLTAAAHVITDSTSGFNAKGSSGTATFTAAIGNAVLLEAYNGFWYAVAKTGVAIA